MSEDRAIYDAHAATVRTRMTPERLDELTHLLRAMPYAIQALVTARRARTDAQIVRDQTERRAREEQS